MPTDQYHEPPAELAAETRTFARMCASLAEEAEAIGWYEQRISVEPDAAARAIMVDSLGEEFKHFCMELEFMFRAKPLWREIARGILFRDGDIVANGEASEAAATGGGAVLDAAHQDGDLGIGSLRGSVQASSVQASTVQASSAQASVSQAPREGELP